MVKDIGATSTRIKAETAWIPRVIEFIALLFKCPQILDPWSGDPVASPSRPGPCRDHPPKMPPRPHRRDSAGPQRQGPAPQIARAIPSLYRADLSGTRRRRRVTATLRGPASTSP